MVEETLELAKKEFESDTYYCPKSIWLTFNALPGFSERSIRRSIQNGTIPSVRCGGRWLIKGSDVFAYVSARFDG